MCWKIEQIYYREIAKVDNKNFYIFADDYMGLEVFGV